MLVLGLTGGIDSLFESTRISDTGVGHDSAAVLMKDGVVICGIEEERLLRIKHTEKFCSSAVRFCLKNSGYSFNDVDAIALYASEEMLNEMLKFYKLEIPALADFSNIRELYQALFEREFGVKISQNKFSFIHHHSAHAAASYYLSGFEKSLVLTIDGQGDFISSMVANANDKNFEVLKTKSVSDSLGLFYLKVIAFLGYKDFDEYKVMGLAPYGNAAVYRDKLNQFYDLLPNGDFCIHSERIVQMYDILQPRHRDEVFAQIHMDIAAALQEALESIVFHVLRHYQKLTGHTHLVISGGVAQNSSMNGKILSSGLFEEIFIPSFAGDSGCTYGAAAYVTHQIR